MKVGDLVQLKDSVLHIEDSESFLGVVTEKYNEAVKVFWFKRRATSPSSSQFVLKLKVVSSL